MPLPPVDGISFPFLACASSAHAVLCSVHVPAAGLHHGFEVRFVRRVPRGGRGNDIGPVFGVSSC